jgi:hypothetical protein
MGAADTSPGRINHADAAFQDCSLHREFSNTRHLRS